MTYAKYAEQKRTRQAWRHVPKNVRSNPPACPRHLKLMVPGVARIGMPVWRCRMATCDRVGLVSAQPP